MTQPNILFICTDEQWGGSLSCAGNDELSTPHIDRLAQQGVRFDQTYCTYPCCAPSRASLFTGRYPHEVGVECNTPEQQLTDAARKQVLGHTLTAAGYDCYYGGKWHIQEHSIPDQVHGFARICELNDDRLPAACADAFNREHDKPWFVVASFDNPHNILEGARDTPLPWGEIDRVPTDHCPNLPPNFHDSPYEPEALLVERSLMPFAFRAHAYTADDWRWYRHLYNRLVEKVDAQIGKVLDALDASGHADNTVVIFTSDHGDMQGAHRWNQKWVLYEESVRVPLIICPRPRKGSQADQGGRVDAAHLVSNGLDLYPTICDYAGATPPDDLRGRSLRPLVEGGDVPDWRDHVAVETWFGPCFKPSMHTRGRSIRTQRYKYSMYSWGKHREQLFDLENDPGEVTNLAVEQRYADVLQRHRDLLSAHMCETNDQYFAHYAHPGQLPPVPGAGFDRPDA